MSRKLYKYIIINIVKIILKSSVKEDLNNYESFQLDDAYVYNKDVKQEMIEKDNDTKIIIINKSNNIR
ncbi:hypothetical protein H8356DRAFT_1340838 [Neocallimastix lanati (nom. inval.)]|nr:hypothetical protein H8356DRAFT_1340838 [Neocallimastix sp. JGI-2020a]